MVLHIIDSIKRVDVVIDAILRHFVFFAILKAIDDGGSWAVLCGRAG